MPPEAKIPLRQMVPKLPVMAMTAWGNVPLTVAAMRVGAADSIEKPRDNTRLGAVLRAQVAQVLLVCTSCVDPAVALRYE